MIGEMPSQANQPLPEGTVLQKYRIRRVLAIGGFSFVYLAHDEHEAPVAIKEYLPATLALRVNGDAHPKVAAQVPSEDLARFRAGMKCFFEEAGALARLEHPNVVRVLDFFRANDTVYLVMRYERGRSLHEHIRKRRGPLEELWVRNTFAQLLDGLREVHAHKLLHLDIKPANIYLRKDGSPVLIDFGAARQVLSAEGTKLSPAYTPGFAAPEMHANREILGPWSDIYSIGATMYACLAAAAHGAILREAERQRFPENPRTVIAACVVQDGHVFWSHVGDCRFYLLRTGRVLARSRDHTVVQRLVDEGRIREEAVATHPHRNRLLQCLGGYQDPGIEPVASAQLAREDILLLCSDGLWGPLSQRQLMHALLSRPLGEAIPELVALAEASAGPDCDNISVVAMAWDQD